MIGNRIGDTIYAREMGEIAISHCRNGGYGWGLASALNELAMAQHVAGDYESSLASQFEALEIKRRAYMPQSLALSLADLAATLLAVARREEAAPVLTGVHGASDHLGRSRFGSTDLSHCRASVPVSGR